MKLKKNIIFSWDNKKWYALQYSNNYLCMTWKTGFSFRTKFDVKAMSHTYCLTWYFAVPVRLIALLSICQGIIDAGKINAYHVYQ